MIKLYGVPRSRTARAIWMLEELQIPYENVPVNFIAESRKPEYLKINPNGHIPALQDGDLTLFESGAIVHYVAERSPVLLPESQPDRAHVMQWMFAALNTVEVVVMELAGIDLFYSDARWAAERRPGAVEAVRKRLAELATRVHEREYLVGAFSAADILMATVLKILRHTQLLEEQPRLVAYKERCEARPAYAKALAGQMSAFAA